MPPVPTAVADAVDCPKQATFTTVSASTVAVTAVGWVTVTVAVAAQPSASVAVTVIGPAANPVVFCVD